MIVTKRDIDRLIEEDELAVQSKVQERKQRRVRDLLTSLNSLGAALLAAIRVAERQIAVLKDLHTVFSTSYRTRNSDYGKGRQLQRNPFHKNIIPIRALLENPKQIWPDTLDTIDVVVQERKSFVKEIKELVENMEIRRKIV